jgi:hypothetical protein
MPYENNTPTLQAFGNAGNNIAANTVVATLALPAPGTYKIWGMARHGLIDGLKLVTPVALILCSAANDTASFGPLIVSVSTIPTSIVIQLNTATGAAETASAVVFAQRMQ